MKNFFNGTCWAIVWYGFTLLMPFDGFSQITPPKFPPLSEDAFDMTLARQFPDAQAVVLFDYGEVAFEFASGVPKARYHYFRRILLLKDVEPGAGKVEIRYNEDGKENLLNVRGATYQLNTVGRTVAFKLDRKRIEKRKEEGGERSIVFELPFAKKGSILEYGYSLYSDEIRTLKPWRFQGNLPVMRSEYHTLIPDLMNYVIIGRGNLEGLEKYRESAGLHTFLVHNTFIMNSLPAVHREPFMPVESDVLPQLTFTRVEGRKEGTGAGDWDNFNQKMLLGRAVSPSPSAEKTLAETAREISGNFRGREEKAAAIYDYVRSTYEWNGEYEAYSEGAINRVINQKRGNSAEINLILMSMLRSIGMKSSPVLISTRENGRPQTLAPMLAQFNHLIVVCEIGQDNLLVDAIGEDASFTGLPLVDLNGQGFAVRKEKWGWMPIVSSDKLFRQTYSRIDLDASGEISGVISVRNEGYTADRERRRYKSYSVSEDYFREQVLSNLPTAKVGEQYLKNQEQSTEAFVTRVEFSTKELRFLESNGDYLLFRPMLTRSIPENPFREEERAYPLDLPVPTNERYVLAMVIPEGYEAVQLPPSIHVKLPGESGEFKYQSQVVGPFLQLVSSITLNQTVFMPEEYGAVRSFFDYIVEKHAEAIVFRKLPEGTSRVGTTQE